MVLGVHQTLWLAVAAQEKLVMKTQKKAPIEEKDEQGRRKPVPLEEKFEFLKNAPVQGKYVAGWPEVCICRSRPFAYHQ